MLGRVYTEKSRRRSVKCSPVLELVRTPMTEKLLAPLHPDEGALTALFQAHIEEGMLRAIAEACQTPSRPRATLSVLSARQPPRGARRRSGEEALIKRGAPP